MFSQDPRMNPNTANVIGSSELQQPYARRTIKAILGFAFALVLVGAFVGWFIFSPPDKAAVPTQGAPAQIAANGQAQSLAVQAPGNEYEKGTGRSAVYNFFYKIFGGIDDGLENSPHNLKNVEPLNDVELGLVDNNLPPTLALKQIAEQRAKQLEALNQDDYRHSVKDVVGSEVYDSQGSIAGNIFDVVVNKNTGKAKAIIVEEDNSAYERDLTALTFKRVLKQGPDGDVTATVTEEMIDDKPDFSYSSLKDTNYVSLRNLYDGQLLDYEGNVTGQVDAVIYSNAEAQTIYFTLRPLLAEQGGVSKFQLPFEDVNIIKSADGYDIKLTKEQTIALAEKVLQ